MFWKKAKKRKKPVFYDMTDEHGLSYVNMSDTIDYIPIRNGEFLYKCEEPYEFKFEGNRAFSEVGASFNHASRIFQRFNELMRSIDISERERTNRYCTNDISTLMEVSSNE